MDKEVDLFKMMDFRTYVLAWVKSRPRGEFRRISESLGMHTTLISQVFKGKKCLTEEQSANLCLYMGLSLLERDYFLKLVQIERAGSVHLKEIFQEHLNQIRSQAQEVKNRIPKSREMGDLDRAVFYSSWQYGVVRLLTSMDEYRTVDAIAQFLNLSSSRVQEILSFLVTRGLCTFKDGLYYRTNQNTHVDAHSPLSIRHHQNWRAKSLSLLEGRSVGGLSFTAPVSIARKDIVVVREILLETISKVSKVVEDSPPEAVVYLGIDWLKL